MLPVLFVNAVALDAVTVPPVNENSVPTKVKPEPAVYVVSLSVDVTHS